MYDWKISIGMVFSIGKDCYIAPTAVILGKVTIGDRVAIFDNAVIRADLNEIIIGDDTNIQDNVTIHVEKNHATRIGKGVSIGHNAIVHGSEVENTVLIGMGAILLNGCHIRKGTVVAAGALVPENFESSENALLVGAPAKEKRNGEEMYAMAEANYRSYTWIREQYLSGNVDRYRNNLED